MALRHHNKKKFYSQDESQAPQAAATRNPFMLIAPGDVKNDASCTVWTWIQDLLKVPGSSVIQMNYQDMASCLTIRYLEQLTEEVLQLPKWVD
jgi:hypothetical protein